MTPSRRLLLGAAASPPVTHACARTAGGVLTDLSGSYHNVASTLAENGFRPLNKSSCPLAQT